MQMPEMDGLMLGQRDQGRPLHRRHAPRHAHLPRQPDRRRGMKKAGIEACVLKPVKQSRLFNRIAEVMAGHRPLSPQENADRHALA